jgi:hypothetical protein
MLIWYNASRVTLHHNLFVKGRNRNPKVGIDGRGTPDAKTTLDMRNNVIWDWGPGSGTLIQYGATANVVNNYYGNFSGGMTDRQQSLIICNGSGVWTPGSMGVCGSGDPLRNARGYTKGNVSAHGIDLNAVGLEREPFPAPPVDVTDACLAARQVLAQAGVRPLDWIDERYVAGITLQGCPPSSPTSRYTRGRDARAASDRPGDQP